MGRGRDPGGSRNIDSLRRRQARRADAARTQKVHREKQRTATRKHTRSFFSPGLSVAKRQARKLGSEVRVEQTGGGGGLLGRGRWTEAAIEIVSPSMSISVCFSAGDDEGSGGNSAIDVRIDGRRVSNCPPEVLQSGDRRGFVAWLEETLRSAAERAQRGA
jgi:hypothetical protein